MNFEFLILLLGIFLIITGYSKQITNNDKEIEIKYIPRNVYDELVVNSVLN